MGFLSLADVCILAFVHAYYFPSPSEGVLLSLPQLCFCVCVCVFVCVCVCVCVAQPHALLHVMTRFINELF